MHGLLRASRGGALIVAVASIVASAPARADDAGDGDRMEQARRTVTAADIDYKLGRFTAALDKYTRAYELYPVAPLLFNIAQCHKNLRDYEKAIFFYEGYLRDAPRANNRALVEDLIREAKLALNEQTATPPESPPVSAPVSEPRSVAPASPAASDRPTTSSSVLAPTPAPATSDVRRSRWVPGIMVAGGTAVLAGGGVLYYYGQKGGPDEMYIYDDTRWVGGAMVALGGAALVAGAVLWVRSSPSSGAPVASIAPGGGYVAWTGRF